MTGLPEFGDRVRVWVRPGRKAQTTSRPVDPRGGGRFIVESEEVVWSSWHLTQLLAGDITIHNPSPQE